MIRIQLPHLLQTLAKCDREVKVQAPPPVSLLAAIRALEGSFPALRGTILDQHTGQRRPKVRFFACSEDLSLSPLELPLPEAVQSGSEPLLIVGAISGG